MNAYIEYTATNKIRINVGNQYVFYAHTAANAHYAENSGYYLVQAWK